MWITLNMSLDSQKSCIETRISELIYDQFNSLACKNLISSCDKTIKDVVKQAISSSEGGKRLRAYLALEAFDAVRGNCSKDTAYCAMLDVACALEVFQTAALVHDDIIDESALRRGRPSAYCALSKACNSKHIGIGLGLMLGDILATQSFDITRKACTNLRNPQEVLGEFANMQRNVGIGQVLDLSIEMMSLKNPKKLAESSINVFRWKTASYTTIAPLALGFLSAGLNKNYAIKLANDIGEPLGIAFQIADDLIDIVSDSAHTGKPIGGDIREGKRTVLLADALDLSSSEDRLFLIDAYNSNNRNEDDVNRIINIFNQSGAISKSKKRIHNLWVESQEKIDNSTLSEFGKSILNEVSSKFIPREWQ
ncbi:polyprenyl synthetase family protein [Gardnerella vaginalis]|nr:polyprenyl synthetase family protein [Gardnerella vaginalis]PNL25870.1 serralysin [Gardnerella vaginalis]PTE04367.1 polyprenyl synthetase family protein [Gardnerella vaginalis]